MFHAIFRPLCVCHLGKDFLNNYLLMTVSMQGLRRFGSTGVLVVAHESVVLSVGTNIRCPTI